MRKPIVALGCLLLFGGGWWIGNGQTAQHLAGGRDWKILPRTDHGLYLAGFVQGYWRGTVHGGFLAVEHNAPEKMPPMQPAAKNELALAHKVAPFLLKKIHPPATLSQRCPPFTATIEICPFALAMPYSFPPRHLQETRQRNKN